MSEEHRLKIKTDNILSYLQRCALGETDKSATQVRAAEILLRKMLPDLRDPSSKRPGRACGARTRVGTPCRMRAVPGGKCCGLHGGLSTGPKTAEGRARIAEAQR